MRTPIADYEVHLQKGVRVQVMEPLSRAAKARNEGESPEQLLDLIALRMKENRNVGDNGPGHVLPNWDTVPEAYRREYDSLHIERYFGVQVSYGIRSNPPQLMIISAVYPPAMA